MVGEVGQRLATRVKVLAHTTLGASSTLGRVAHARTRCAVSHADTREPVADSPLRVVEDKK